MQVRVPVCIDVHLCRHAYCHVQVVYLCVQVCMPTYVCPFPCLCSGRHPVVCKYAYLYQCDTCARMTCVCRCAYLCVCTCVCLCVQALCEDVHTFVSMCACLCVHVHACVCRPMCVDRGQKLLLRHFPLSVSTLIFEAVSLNEPGSCQSD